MEINRAYILALAVVILVIVGLVTGPGEPQEPTCCWEVERICLATNGDECTDLIKRYRLCDGTQLACRQRNGEPLLCWDNGEPQG